VPGITIVIKPVAVKAICKTLGKPYYFLSSSGVSRVKRLMAVRLHRMTWERLIGLSLLVFEP
jgi:hypothetical protein